MGLWIGTCYSILLLDFIYDIGGCKGRNVLCWMDCAFWMDLACNCKLCSGQSSLTISPSCNTFTIFPFFRLWVKFIIAIFAPWYSFSKAASQLYSNGKYMWAYGLVLAIPFYCWILFMILEVVVVGMSYVGWTVLFGFFTYAAGNIL